MSSLRRVALVFVTVPALFGSSLAPVEADAAARPSTVSVSPTAVSIAGSTKITIRGKNLSKVSAVYFGKTKTTKITHVSRTKLIVVAIKHRLGTVKLKLRVGKKNYATSLKVRYVVPVQRPSSFETEVLQRTNNARVSGRTCVDAKTGARKVMPAVPALKRNRLLAYAARAHSKDMAKKRYFSHTSADGTAFSTRISRTGYAWSAVGENIAAGQSSPKSVVNAWLASYGHCRNLMSASFTELGVGFAAGGPYRTYWTQDFGRRRS